MIVIMRIKVLDQVLSGSWGPFDNETKAHEFAVEHGMDQGSQPSGQFYELLFINSFFDLSRDFPNVPANSWVSMRGLARTSIRNQTLQCLLSQLPADSRVIPTPVGLEIYSCFGRPMGVIRVKEDAAGFVAVYERPVFNLEEVQQ